MRTTSLRYPKRSKFIQIHEWQLEATNGNQPAAALLSVLEYRHNYLIENREFEKAVAAALKAQKKTAPLEFRGWQFYTDTELENLLMLWKKEAILGGVRKLIDLGFVETEPPEVLKNLFKTGRQKWFRFRADLVNQFLDQFNARQFGNAETGAPAPETPEEKKKRRLVSMAELECEAGESLMAQARTVFADWKLVLDTPQSVEDAKRLKLAVARLKEGFTVSRLRLAIRGVVCLDYNMGFNPEGREHWGFDLIFRDSAHVEKYEQAAKEKGFTEENLDQIFLNRLDRRIREIAAAPEAAKLDYTIYRETAKILAEGVASYTDQKDLLARAKAKQPAELKLEPLLHVTLEELAALTVINAPMRGRAEMLCKILLGEN